MDEENIIISMFASSKKVSKVITKMTRMSLMSMMPQVKIENSVVSPKYLIANNIIRFVRSINNADGENSIETLYKIVDSRVEAIEFKLKENFKAFGIPLKDLKIKPNILIACIKRDTEVIRPNGTTTIEQGDRVIIVTTNDGLTKLNDILA
jgi:trk system potassium uptake protein TrkA